MTHPSVILLVRLKSSLPRDAALAMMEERVPEFRALAGLQQKYYLEDPVSGEFAGLYFWDSPDSLSAFRESDLRASIAEAYEAEGEPRLEVYRVFRVLRDETT